MIKKISSLVALMIVLALIGCEKEETMKNISEISFVSEAGSILPELRWHEEYTITKESVFFKRSGNADSQKINVGNWNIPVDAQAISAMFNNLETINLKSISRVEPLDSPDGGDSSYYVIKYADDKVFSLDFNPGVTYTNGHLITQPVQNFLQNLEMPLHSVSRYNER